VICARKFASDAVTALLLAGLLLLAACGGQTSFSDLTFSDGARQAPPISLSALDGLPPPVAATFTEAMRSSAQKRGLTLVQGSFTEGFKLSGLFGTDGAGLSYDWTLTNPKGDVLLRLNGAESGPSGTNPFAPSVLARVAEATAETLSSRLLQMGYSTRASGMPPPLHAFQEAGPGAEKDIDYETLMGPGMGPPGEMVAEEPPVPTKPDLPAAAAPKAKSSEPAIKAIALLPVTGSPGRGNAELRGALKAVLLNAGWPVVDAARPDALSISGVVTLSAPAGSTQRVALAWTVTKPDGTEVGVVRQANQVPSGSLDAGWGETADYAAQAAAEGLADLVQRLR
jgi:hypothetical protein